MVLGLNVNRNEKGTHGVSHCVSLQVVKWLLES